MERDLGSNLFQATLKNLNHYPFQASLALHVETSNLFCSAEQMTVFYMKWNAGLKWVKNVIGVSERK